MSPTGSGTTRVTPMPMAAVTASDTANAPSAAPKYHSSRRNERPVKRPPATLDREARRQGRRADAKRAQLDGQINAGQGREQALPLPETPFTLVIELDAWNLRERDGWGQSERQRACGQEPPRWHWVDGGACFRLDQRVESQGGRARILSRGTVMTRSGVAGLRAQLFAEAQRHGLAQAAKVLVVADGAVWIWKLVGDRFEQAHQRLDDDHASQHLWTVAHALHPEDPAAARVWIAPRRKQLKGGRATALLNDLRTLAKRLRQKKRHAVESELAYLESHRHRLDYAVARRAGKPQGSGAMESTCRQYQCRFKRPGQFWSCAGDEGLMCWATFWRNRRWHLLFPHILHGNPCIN